MDATAVRTMAARAGSIADQVAADAAALRALALVDWSGEAAHRYTLAAEDAARHAAAVERALRASAAALQRHATGVDAALAEQRRLAARLGLPW